MKSVKNLAAATRRHEFFVVRQRQRYQLFCEKCDADTEFVSVDDAVLFSGFATREIVGLVDNGKLHFRETTGGHLFVCQTSIGAIASEEFLISSTNQNGKPEPDFTREPGV